MGCEVKVEISPANNVYSAIVHRLICRVLESRTGAAPRSLERRAERPFSFTEFSRDVVVELSQAYRCDNPAVRELLNQASSVIDEVFKSAVNLFDVVLLLDMEALSRITVHTRSPFMPLEIGVSWHPYLNVPYIPSTTIKGLLRAYIASLRPNVCGVGLDGLLGSTDEMSGIMVSDALPTACRESLVEPDVLTQHYREVEGRISEVEARPTPLVFPTIAPGTRLRFVVAIRLKGQHGKEVTCIAKELPRIVEAAFQLGVGAKTSVGYGAVKISLLNRWPEAE